ncbi:MAG: C13 family peptidase [Candidatus Binatia bacterium]
MQVLLRNSVNAFRFAFFHRASEDHVPIAWWQIAAFGIASVLIPGLYDIASIGLDGRVEWYAIPSAMAHLPIVLFAAIGVAYALSISEKTPFLLQTFLMTTVAIDLTVYTGYPVIEALFNEHASGLLSIGFYVLPPIWLAAACAKTATGLVSVPQGRKTLAYAACIVLLALPLTQMYRERSLWQATEYDDSVSSGDGTEAMREDAFYSQPKLLERELAAVRRGRPGVIEIYFIGMGGYAYQDVFMKEIEATSRIFRERFGAEGRTIRLVNNAKSLDSAPIASVTSLRASLKRVAEVMNKDEDLLFLFLTSHGSETHRFSLDFWPLQFHELDPPTLRDLLDESGIRYRVIVVSACYSGGFINALRNENTLVIAAAAPDRNSFGCSNEAEWTYFGKAYFDEALRSTYSFVEAFEIAKPVIAERERKERHKPSDPQMALGESIKSKLLELQQHLVAR